jgi:hypothetical protein
LAQSRAKDIEEKEEAGRHKKAPQPVYDQLKVPDEGVADFQVGSSFDTHAALLGGANTDAQRSDVAMHLQKTYGNRYVQRLVESTKVQAKLIVNSPDDEYEREADRVADAVTRTPASSVQRQVEPEEEEEEEEEEPIQTKMSRIQRQAATETKAEAPKAEAPAAEKGLDKARLAALKALWDAVIVTRVRETYQALDRKTPDIKLAYGKVDEAAKTTDTIRNAYPVESMSRARLTGFYLLLRAKHGELGEHLQVEKVPLAKIRDGFNPDTGDMKQWIEVVKGLL